MKTLQIAVLTMILVLSASTPPYVDHGGIIFSYQIRAFTNAHNKKKVVINYECNSACVILLASGENLSISKDAIFGVHEARRAGGEQENYITGTRDELATQSYKDSLPKCALTLFESRHAFDGPVLTKFSGAEVLQACPELKEFK